MSGTIRLLYCRTRHLSTPFLRLGAWSPWSHVALVLPESEAVIDATFMAGGVRQRSLSQLLDICSKYEFRDLTVPDPEAGYAFARSQLGKPYDWTGVIGLGLHRDWQTDDAWWCSEFVEAVLAAAGRPRFENYVQRVTQQHSWMVR